MDNPDSNTHDFQGQDHRMLPNSAHTQTSISRATSNTVPGTVPLPSVTSKVPPQAEVIYVVQPRPGLPSTTRNGDELRSDKIRRRRGEPEPVTEEWYGPPGRIPRPWGPMVSATGERLFQYNEVGSLKNGTRLTHEQMRMYLLNDGLGDPSFLPYTPPDDFPMFINKQRQGLTLWIGWRPAQSEHRWRNKPCCLFKDCEIKDNTIAQGLPWVILDERLNEKGDQADPFHNAGYCHLWCLERHLDLVSLWLKVDIRPDCRAFEKEERNCGALNRAQYGIVDEIGNWWQSQYPEYLKAKENATKHGGPAGRPYRYEKTTLGYRLVRYCVTHETKARKATRARRGGSNIGQHFGDLMSIAQTRAARRDERRHGASYVALQSPGLQPYPLSPAVSSPRQPLAHLDRNAPRPLPLGVKSPVPDVQAEIRMPLASDTLSNSAAYPALPVNPGLAQYGDAHCLRLEDTSGFRSDARVGQSLAISGGSPPKRGIFENVIPDVSQPTASYFPPHSRQFHKRKYLDSLTGTVNSVASAVPPAKRPNLQQRTPELSILRTPEQTLKTPGNMNNLDALTSVLQEPLPEWEEYGKSDVDSLNSQTGLARQPGSGNHEDASGVLLGTHELDRYSLPMRLAAGHQSICSSDVVPPAVAVGDVQAENETFPGYDLLAGIIPEGEIQPADQAQPELTAQINTKHSLSQEPGRNETCEASKQAGEPTEGATTSDGHANDRGDAFDQLMTDLASDGWDCNQLEFFDQDSASLSQAAGDLQMWDGNATAGSDGTETHQNVEGSITMAASENMSLAGEDVKQEGESEKDDQSLFGAPAGMAVEDHSLFDMST